MNKSCLLIIISYNQLDYTRACVESVHKNTRYPHQVLIIDNGSDVQTMDYLRELRSRREADVIFNKENQGWIGGVNQGLEYGDYAYYCVMNNDIVVYANWLDEMVKVAESKECIGLVNPEWEIPKRYWKDHERFLKDCIVPNAAGSVETDWMRGFCFLVKRSVVREIGGLDKIYGAGYYDDWDYSVRAIRAGYKCVRAKGALVYHCKNVTFLDYMKGLEYNVNFNRNKALFYNRWGRPLRILIIYTEDLLGKKEEVRELVYRLLRNQDNIFFVRTVDAPLVAHTNCVQKTSSDSFVHWNIWRRLVNNLRHSIGKRYNLILCSQEVKNKITKFPIVINQYKILTLEKTSNDALWNEIKKLRRYK